MENRTKIIIASVALLTSYAFGRFSAPDHVKIETKIVEVEKKVTDTDKEKHQKKVVEEIELPDGTKKKTTTIVQDTDTKTHVEDDKSKTSDTIKETDKGSKVTLAALGGVALHPNGTDPILYGGMISKPILGPITVGIWGLSNATAGAAVGLTF
jgi:hypothetical protein